MNTNHRKCPTCGYELPEDDDCRICAKRLLVARRRATHSDGLSPPTSDARNKDGGLLNVAISLAFLLSVFFSPGQRFVGLLIDAPVLQSLPAGQQGIVLAIAGYWLPATLLYVALRFIPHVPRLKPTRGEAIVLSIGNFILILYVIARVFASTVEGGGASFAVASFSIFTAFPALIAVGVILLKIVIRVLSATTTEQRSTSFSSGHVVAIALLGFGPVTYAFGTLFIGERSPFHLSRVVEKRMAELCTTAGEKLLGVPVGVEGIFLAQDSAARYENIDRGVYRASGIGIIGEPLVNSGWLRFFETPTYVRNSAAPTDAKYERYLIQQKRQPVDELMSRYGVFRSKLTTKEDEKVGTDGYELAVKDMSSGDIIATSRYFLNRKTRKICGHETNKSIDEGDFMRRALNLEQRFDSLWPKQQ